MAAPQTEDDLRRRQQQTLELFERHVSPAKSKFFRKYGLDMVMGLRERCHLRSMGPVNAVDNSTAIELFNLHCNGGVFNLGHHNEEIVEVLKQALDDGLDIGNHHLISEGRALVGAKLAELMPGDISYTVFSAAGGEAVDVALKVSRGYTGREKVISVMGGYHGHTGLALSTGDLKFRAPFNHWLPGFVQVPFGDIGALLAELDDQTAAVIIESIPATLGMPLPPADYLSRVREACTRVGAQMILDEVQTGLGRTGTFLACEHFLNIETEYPDIVVIGKGLSGGIYPIAATCFRPHLMRVFDENPFVHVSTFGGSELGCRVALKVLEKSSSPEFLEHVQDLAGLWCVELEKLRQKHDGFLLEIRQCGLFIGLRMKDELCGPVMMKTAFESGLLLAYADNDKCVSQLLPPLIMNPEELPAVIAKLDRALVAARKLHPLARAKESVTSVLSMSRRSAPASVRPSSSFDSQTQSSSQLAVQALGVVAFMVAGAWLQKRFSLM